MDEQQTTINESSVKIDEQVAAKGDAENVVQSVPKEQVAELLEQQPSRENGTSEDGAGEMKSNGQPTNQELVKEAVVADEGQEEAVADTTEQVPEETSADAAPVAQSNTDNDDPKTETQIDSETKMEISEPAMEADSPPSALQPSTGDTDSKSEEETVPAPLAENDQTDSKSETESAEKPEAHQAQEEPKDTQAEEESKQDPPVEESKEDTEAKDEVQAPVDEPEVEAAAEVEPDSEDVEPEAPKPDAEAGAGQSDTQEDVKEEGEDSEQTSVSEATPTKKKRGRPAKGTPKPAASPKSPRKGRPPKATQNESTEQNVSEDKVEEPMDTEDTAVESTTPQLGLLERPVEIQTGKRNRRKVDRLAENITATPAAAQDKKKFSIPEGKGVKLGDCPAIEEVINKTKAEELKIFHKFLYGSPGKSSMEIKKNVRSFCGWQFSTGDAEYRKKTQALSKINLPVLKSWCGMLKLAVGGSKDGLIDRLMSYLIEPTAEGKELQAKLSETGKRKRGAAAKSKDLVEDSDAEEGADQSDDEAEDSDAEDKPAAKKRRTATKSPGRKPKAAAKGTPKLKGRGRGRKSGTGSSVLVEPQGPPTDEVIRAQIEKILETADLEVVTMKTVRQQILDMYSEFDLSNKRDFIKSTVKEILGA